MRKLWTVALLTLALLAIPGAAAADQSGQNPATEFVATLTGGQEVPPVATAATGRVTFELDEDGTIEYEATMKNITGVFMAHIHAPALPGQNAGVLVWLCGNGVGPPGTPPCTNRGFEGRVHVTAAVLNFMRTGRAYANVHTLPSHPGGEIRGQIRTENDESN
jgi:hypothetical protein